MKKRASVLVPISAVLLLLLIVVVIGFVYMVNTQNFETQSAPETVEEEIVKSTVNPDDIVGGGPPKDGIPSIDEPQFISVSEAEEWLGDEEGGIVIEYGETTRFYPFQILVWHEIVNDQLPDGDRFLVTYCPLCFSGVVFDPVVDGEEVEFGTSGKLWNSNLVMYDRKTDSYWSQILGEAIMGERAGDTLEILESDRVQFGEWKALHPDGEVLSRETGTTRFYGDDPYGNYYTNNEEVLFPVDATDDRLENKDYVLGVVIDGQAKAYYPPAVQEQGEVTDEFAGRTFTLRYEEEIDSVRIYELQEDGTEQRINPLGGFWFSWVAAHPNTELFQ